MTPKDMLQMPRDTSLDSTFAFLSEGYRFISNRCERYNTDIFETRLMLRHAICAMGSEAAAMFYHPDRFTRQGALPATVVRLLQDKGSVQSLDGAAHRHRKQMFMSVMTPENIQRLVNLSVEQWRQRLKQWVTKDEVVLHNEVQAIFCWAVCQWMGISLSPNELRQRTREFAAMLDGAGSIGPRNWWGQLLRLRSERWARELIDAVRARQLNVPTESALHVIAWHRDLNDELLDSNVAAVELINFLRPTVAVARFVTFAALALHEHPECHGRLLSGDDSYPQLFTQEVRRFYPVFPAIAGHARHEFEWRGYYFPKEAWVILDIYGTNHDPHTWQDPEHFKPDRFRQWDESPFNFIPQGGGDYYADHRCPGEWIAIALTKAALSLLTHEMQYDVPPQNLHIDFAKMPAIPDSHFVMTNVRQV